MSQENTNGALVKGPDDSGSEDQQTLLLTQKRFSTRTRFEFAAEDFAYQIDADGSSRSYRMEYADLSLDRETLVDRNSWWRNVGVIWIVLGVALALTTYAESQTLRIPIWLTLGLICLAVYQFRVVRYQIIPAERCKVLIVDDAAGAKIMQELERRRAAQLRRRYDFITLNEHPEQQRHRINWLRKQKVLDEHEVSARLLQIDSMLASQALRRSEQGDQDE